jgi:arylsulfatase A-like enzyme
VSLVGLWAAVLLACGPVDTATETGLRPDRPATAAGGQEPATDPLISRLVLSGPRPRNLLVLSVDTLRRDKVGRYSGGTQTPFLDSVLDESVALDDHRSCSNWTYASLLCALTGQTTVDLGFEPVGNRQGANMADGTAPPDDLKGLAHWLVDAGFVTSLVTTSRFLSDDQPPGGAFQTVAHEDDAVGERVTALGLEAVAPLMAQDAPWYLHVHYRDPHFPYTAPLEFEEGLAELEGSGYSLTTQAGVNALEADWDILTPEAQDLALAWLNGLQDAEIRYYDQQLQVLWDALEEQGALEDTLVVLFSDHGEQFFEHGEFMHYKALFSEESAALGAFWARSLVPLDYAGPTVHTDLVPGVLDLLGVPIPDSVTGQVPGTRRSDRPRHAFFGPPGTRGGPTNTVDLDGYRLHYDWSGRRRLYDLGTDPSEQVDLHGTIDSTQLERHLVAEVERSMLYVTWVEPQDLTP